MFGFTRSKPNIARVEEAIKETSGWTGLGIDIIF